MHWSALFYSSFVFSRGTLLHQVLTSTADSGTIRLTNNHVMNGRGKTVNQIVKYLNGFTLGIYKKFHQ